MNEFDYMLSAIVSSFESIFKYIEQAGKLCVFILGFYFVYGLIGRELFLALFVCPGIIWATYNIANYYTLIQEQAESEDDDDQDKGGKGEG